MLRHVIADLKANLTRWMFWIASAQVVLSSPWSSLSKFRHLYSVASNRCTRQAGNDFLSEHAYNLAKRPASPSASAYS
jgi:hypothetical protein